MAHNVQMVNDNYVIKNKPEMKTKYPHLYEEVVQHDKDLWSSWYELSDEAYEEYLQYCKEA